MSRDQTTFRLRPSRRVFAQVARGSVKLNGVTLVAGDGVALSQEEILEFAAVENSEALLFDSRLK